MSTTRRAFIKTLMGLPVVGYVTNWLFGWSDVSWSDESRRHEAKFLAVRVIRLINTAERRYFNAEGRFTNLTVLWDSEPANQFLNSKGANSADLGRSLYSTLNFGSREVTPGWRLDFSLQSRASGYLVRMTDISDRKLGAFASDESGRIHEGKAATEQSLDLSQPAAAQLLSAWQIGTSTGTRPVSTGTLGSLLDISSFGPLIAYAGCHCVTYPCCCNCGCDTNPNGGCAVDCGCVDCTWCCCGC